MAIKSYLEDGILYYQVYVHVRSPLDRSKRSQKYTKRLKTEAEARREEKRLLQEAAREVQKMEGLGLTWEEVVNLWATEYLSGRITKRMGKRSSKEYVQVVHKWTQSWTTTPIPEFNRSHGRDLILRMEKQNLSKNYQVKIKNIINSVFDWAVQYGYIKDHLVSPLKGIILDNDVESIPDILNLEETKRFLTAAKLLDHPWYPVWCFATMTGMRSGELYALTWKAVDLDKELIYVHRSYDSNLKAFGPTKGRYWRTVPISSHLKKLILELKSNLDSNKEVDDLGDALLLPRTKDWTNGDQAQVLRSFLRSIKVRSIKFHALRAIFATQMLANGVPAPMVMKIGGWKRMATMDIYLRLAGVETKGATEGLGFIPEDLDFGSNVVKLFNSES